MSVAAMLLVLVAAGDTITERAVQIPGPVPLPGILTMPAAALTQRVPAVVIVHGSGPGDRDGTVGNNTPYRDLAWGLAERGIAVLRYDKRTKVHPFWFFNRPFTVNDEVIDDAVTAARLLREQPEVDPGRIYVAGHSLGGYLMPRIAAAEGQLAGMIVLAGAYDAPLGDLLLAQLDYIASVADPADTAAIAAQRRMLTPMVAAIARLTPADSTGTTLIIGAPPAYWLDLNRYDPVEAMRQRPEPALILQGERDYQVTPTMFEGYLARLGERPATATRRFPGLNHLFIAGEGPSRPAEYALSGRMSDAVIDAIAEWISR